MDLPQAGPSGLGERGPVRRGEPPGTGFPGLPFRHGEAQMEGEAPTHSSFGLLSQFNSEPVEIPFGDPCRLSLLSGPSWSGQGRADGSGPRSGLRTRAFAPRDPMKHARPARPPFLLP